MGRFVEGADRSQLTLLPECLENWVSEDNAVHVIDVFVEALDLHGMGFERVVAKETGRPAYHPRLCPMATQKRPAAGVMQRPFADIAVQWARMRW